MKYYASLMYYGLSMATLVGLAQDEKSLSLRPEKFIDPANMDKSVKPGDDFYRYASGTWLINNPVPAKETRWGSFNQLRDFNANAVKSILEEVSSQTSSKPGSVEQRVGDFYASAMDTVAIDQLGASPILVHLGRIDAINDINGVVREMAYLRTEGLANPLYGFGVGQDRKDVTQNVVNLSQGGTTLPDRDYYLMSNKRNEQIKVAYEQYVSALFSLAGENAETSSAFFPSIWEIESLLAEAQLSRVEMRDPYRTYNKLSIAQLDGMAKAMRWPNTLELLGINVPDSVLVNNPEFMASANTLLAEKSLADWKAYLKWNVLKNAAPKLSTPFVEASFAFNQALTGQKVITPRWQRTFNDINRNIGDLLGQLYVARYFKPEAKERMVELVKNLSATFEERINTLDWMSDITKQKALEKLHAFTPKIGYPDKWETYDGLEIKRDDYFGNLQRSSKWAYQHMIDRLGKPVDKSRWGMTPPTVNAYYSPVNNEIAFPAGILQFPFFDFDADDAVNYGGIGAVIGHEMTHGFDDQGRQYGADGNLKDWWTKADADQFKALADQVVEQYNGYTVLDTLNVNGKLTLGENLADLGGLSMAYAAFKNTPQGQSNEVIDGFTPDQRFFLSWAQVWRMNTLPETAAQLILTDPHAPSTARTLGPLVNMDAWYEAFDIQPGDKLYKPEAERIRVW